MKSWGRALGSGVLAWLIPFAVAVAVFPLRDAARPVFESVMAVTVAGTAAALGLRYLGRVPGAGARQGLAVGIVGFAVCVLVDAPLMLVGGPMPMSLAAYMGDIGLTYVSIRSSPGASARPWQRAGAWPEARNPRPKPQAQSSSKEMRMSETALFDKLIGRWEGTCRTWFEPGKLADESKVSGEIAGILDGRFLRHTYAGTIQGKPRRGEETIAFNSVTRAFQVAWVDDFHMNYAIMVSEGQATARGFSVRGDYDVGGGQPKWGWRTEFELVDDDRLTITAYNIVPGGMEAKAVETIYHRVK